MLARLSDGTRVIVRPIRPDDKVRLVAMLLRLSPASVRARFLSPKPRLSDAELRYLTEVDGHDHFALVAVLRDDPDYLVAVARCVRLAEDRRTAEMAIVVGDEHQGKGLGRQLGLALAGHAQARGIQRFTADMFSDNVAAHRLFAAIADRMSTRHQAGVDEVIVELAA